MSGYLIPEIAQDFWSPCQPQTEAVGAAVPLAHVCCVLSLGQPWPIPRWGLVAHGPAAMCGGHCAVSSRTPQ